MQQSVEHKHDIIYFGVVNLIHDSVLMGTIDIWKCRGCSEIFCEDKRYGVQDLAAEVGFPRIEQGAKWAALACIREKGSDWTLTGVKPGNVIHHSCTQDTKVDLTVGDDYSITQGVASGIGKHKIILLEDFVNAAVDVDTGRRHTGPTNANQAPGRPFSFPAEKSAGPARVSPYNISNLSMLTSLVSGLWLGTTGFASNITILQSALFFVVAALGVASSYFTLRRRNLGPLLALATSALGILGLYWLSSTVSSYVVLLPLIILIFNGVFAWFSRSRIRNLSEQKWHPLDMPAYG